MPTHNSYGTNGSAQSGEHASLLRPQTFMPRPTFSDRMWYEGDHRAWMRITGRAFHLTYATLASSYVNLLLVFVPLGIVSGAVGWSPTATFVLNFLAIVPLASLLSFATEELAATLGETLGGLLNATFGNAVELIVSICPDPMRIILPED